MVDRRFDASQILEKIAEFEKEEPWFHCIDLGEGIRTRTEPVQHLHDLWAQISKHIPEDLSGKTVLDIGCNAGFFSVEAKRRNADYVLGVDMSTCFLKQAEFVRDVLELDIDYRKMSIYELSTLNRKFDIVFCLGVIYHCADPVNAARNVIAVTQDTAIVESALLDASDLSDRPLWEFVFPGYEDRAADAAESERCYNWWFPNMKGLETLLGNSGFSTVRTIYEANNRGAVICKAT